MGKIDVGLGLPTPNRLVTPRVRKAGRTRILGVPVSLVDLDRAVETIVGWCRQRSARFVCVRDVHGIMRAQADPALMQLHEDAGLVLPDGMPLVWLARRRGHAGVGRACGAGLCGQSKRFPLITDGMKR